MFVLERMVLELSLLLVVIIARQIIMMNILVLKLEVVVE